MWESWLHHCLLSSNTGKGEMPPHHHLWQAEELILRSSEQKSCPSPSLAAALRGAGPAPHLGSRVELALLVEVAAESVLRA